MKKSSILIILVLVVAILVAAGCNQSPKNSSGAQSDIANGEGDYLSEMTSLQSEGANDFSKPQHNSGVASANSSNAQKDVEVLETSSSTPSADSNSTSSSKPDSTSNTISKASSNLNATSSDSKEISSEVKKPYDTSSKQSTSALLGGGVVLPEDEW